MITLHRLGRSTPFDLNDDLIVTVEATPDTVISLANGNKVVVSESPEEVADCDPRVACEHPRRGVAQRPDAAATGNARFQPPRPITGSGGMLL